MVEYALLLGNLAGTMLQGLSRTLESWAAAIPWGAVTYALMAVVVFKVARWAFRPRDH